MLCEWKITVEMNDQRKKKFKPGVTEIFSKRTARRSELRRREDICLRRLSFIYIYIYIYI